MILICPECGAKNRLPATPEPGRTYNCGRCKTRLTDVSPAPDAVDEKSIVPKVSNASRSGQAQPEKPIVSRSLLANALNWLKGREKLLIFLLALLALLLHLFVIPYWAEPYCDEEHYVPEARSIIYEGELTHPEHPSLGKLFIASGILVFGDNPWGWRVPSAIFGVVSIVLFYLICRKLAGNLAALMASIFLIFETLTFVHSSLAMLDVFSLTFMLLAFLFYLHDRHVFSGISLALSGLCKMTGLLGILVILVHWFVMKKGLQPPRTIGLLLFSALVAFLFLLPLFDFAATREWFNPVDRISDMLYSHGAMTSEVLTPEQLADISYPWEWILSPIGHLSFRPGGAITLINPTVWILIIPSLGYMLYEFTKNKTDVSLFAILWFAATYLLWIPLVLATDRQTYLFYFYPTVGAICMAIGYALSRIWKAASGKWSTQYRCLIGAAMIGYFTISIFLFVFLAPIMRALDYYFPFLPQSS